MSAQSPVRGSSIDWDDFIFDGTDCISFIRSVKIHARNSGMLRENDRIADMISPSFVGNALVWFTQLDPSVTEDWVLLQRAILDKYYDNPVAVSSMPSTLVPSPAAVTPFPAAAAPFPAAAPPPPAAAGPSPSSAVIGTRSPSYPLYGTSHSGRLKVLVEGHHDGEYVSRFPNKEGGIMQSTGKLEDAIKVKFRPSSERHTIKILNPVAEYLWLGAGISEQDPNPALKLVTSLAATADGVVDSSKSCLSFSTVARGKIWLISPLDGLVKMIWELDGNTYVLGGIRSKATGKIFFATNRDAFMERYDPMTNWRRVDFVFETLA